MLIQEYSSWLTPYCNLFCGMKTVVKDYNAHLSMVLSNELWIYVIMAQDVSVKTTNGDLSRTHSTLFSNHWVLSI